MTFSQYFSLPKKNINHLMSCIKNTLFIAKSMLRASFSKSVKGKTRWRLRRQRPSVEAPFNTMARNTLGHKKCLERS